MPLRGVAAWSVHAKAQNMCVVRTAVNAVCADTAQCERMHAASSATVKKDKATSSAVQHETRTAMLSFHLCYYLSIFLYYDPITGASTCTCISPNKKIRACLTNLYASTIYPLASLLAFSEFDCARHSGSVLPEFDCVYRYLNSYSRYMHFLFAQSFWWPVRSSITFACVAGSRCCSA